MTSLCDECGKRVDVRRGTPRDETGPAVYCWQCWFGPMTCHEIAEERQEAFERRAGRIP